MKLNRYVAAVSVAAGSPLAVASLLIGLLALLGLGWAGSPIRLHAPGAAVWATIALGLGLAEIRRTPHGSERRFVATCAIVVAALALAEVAVVLLSFAPCGAGCLR